MKVDSLEIIRKDFGISTLMIKKCCITHLQVESAYYWTTMCLIIQSPDSWKQIRLTLLKRLLATVHVRHALAPNATHLNDKQVKDYTTVYKPGLLFFGLVNGMYTIVFKVPYFFD